MSLIATAAQDGALVIPQGVLLLGACGFGLLAIALAWPVPVLLSRASWPAKVPTLALMLWQLIGLAGGFSMIGALLLGGIALIDSHWWLAALPAALFTVYLLAHLTATIVQVTRQRRRHLELIELLSAPHPTRTSVRVLDNPAPVAYCLPTGITSVTILSQGLLDRLDPDELVAVIAHERAHVEQRHDILQLAFRAWRSALPWVPVARLAEHEVAALVEMLADDQARREVHGDVLARAILLVGTSSEAGSSIAVQDSGRMADRFRRITR